MCKPGGHIILKQTPHNLILSFFTVCLRQQHQIIFLLANLTHCLASIKRISHTHTNNTNQPPLCGTRPRAILCCCCCCCTNGTVAALSPAVHTHHQHGLAFQTRVPCGELLLLLLPWQLIRWISTLHTPASRHASSSSLTAACVFCCCGRCGGCCAQQRCVRCHSPFGSSETMTGAHTTWVRQQHPCNCLLSQRRVQGDGTIYVSVAALHLLLLSVSSSFLPPINSLVHSRHVCDPDGAHIGVRGECESAHAVVHGSARRVEAGLFSSRPHILRT